MASTDTKSKTRKIKDNSTYQKEFLPPKFPSDNQPIRAVPAGRRAESTPCPWPPFDPGSKNWSLVVGGLSPRHPGSNLFVSDRWLASKY
jgi:hypothetical protein